MTIDITGRSASEIAVGLRTSIERGELPPGTLLPPVRSLAGELGVNRNTVVAAYRQLAQAGLVESRGRGGTRVADRATVAQEGYAPDTVLRDVGTGNPDPALIPDPPAALARSAASRNAGGGSGRQLRHPERRSWTGGQRTSPWEQNTQQSPAAGLSSKPQRLQQ